MSRLQLALNVSDLERAVAFYSSLFATEPNKIKPGYANFVIADPPLKLVLFEHEGAGEKLNHLGIEVESTSEVTAAAERLADAGLAPSAPAAETCCYAESDKTWLTDSDGDPWEIYVVNADVDEFGTSLSAPKVTTPAPDRTRRGCCA